MRKVQHPPFTSPLLNSSGKLTPIWIRYFQSLSSAYDLVRRPPDLVYSADATLTSADWGKIVRFDIGTSDINCNLMTMSAIDIDCWITIIRYGSGGRLTIIPPSDTKVEYGTVGGRVWCDEPRRSAANITLQLIKLTQLAITGATGIWKVR